VAAARLDLQLDDRESFFDLGGMLGFLSVLGWIL